MQKTPLSFIELSEENLIHNIKQLKNLAKKGTKFAIAIKGNAYGHGQNEIAKILESLVDYFQVNSILELRLLRKISKKKTFLLGYVQELDLNEVLKLRCILGVFSIKELKKINEIAKKLKIKQEIHIPVDAYLGREGFLKDDLIKFLKEVKNCKNINLSGIYAHFANIEDTNNFTHAKKQIKKYEEYIKIAKNLGFKNLQTHISATSGFLVYEKDKGIHPLVRIGIGIYGMWPSEHIKYMYLPTGRQDKNKIELKPVLSWKTKIVQIKILPAGSTIGYGLSHTVYNLTKIAVIPQGYADGYDRGLSNKGEVLIHGTRCKVLGRVAMNMFVVDVNYLDDVKEEDEVILIGSQGNEQITTEEIALKIDTINYEITTRLSPLLPRIVV